jgi:hypothetical protein
VSQRHLLRYVPWQFRDFVIDRGISIMIIGVLWGYLLIAPVRASMGAVFAASPLSPTWAILMTVISSVVSLSVLIALNGMVSTDRKMGYYRFLFAKPLSPVAFYAQLFVVYMVGVLVAMLMLSLMLKHFVASFSVVNFLLYSALIYIAMGGIGFFISAATRFDWLTLAAVWLGSHMLRSLYGAKPGFVGKLVQLLPPVHKLDDVANGVITYRSAPAGDIVWLLGYGLLFFVLGLLLLKRGQLAD